MIGLTKLTRAHFPPVVLLNILGKKTKWRPTFSCLSLIHRVHAIVSVLVVLSIVLRLSKLLRKRLPDHLNRLRRHSRAESRRHCFQPLLLNRRRFGRFDFFYLVIVYLIELWPFGRRFTRFGGAHFCFVVFGFVCVLAVVLTESAHAQFLRHR